jgi:uncharacterized protein
MLLVLVGAAAAGINSVAGGGSLISFPTLTIPYGIPSVIANATNSVGLWPGSLSGAVGFLNLYHQTAKQLKLLILPTLIGSIIGALLLVSTTQQTFDEIVPFLILAATVILAFQQKVKQWARTEHKKLPLWVGIVLQTLVAIYGGYFGAGMGIMMLATLTLTVEGSMHELNSIKNWLAVAINVACTVLFIANGLVSWLPAAALILGALIGGYATAKVSQRFDPERLRWAIVTYGVIMTLVFLREALLKSH